MLLTRKNTGYLSASAAAILTLIVLSPTPAFATGVISQAYPQSPEHRYTKGDARQQAQQPSRPPDAGTLPAAAFSQTSVIDTATAWGALDTIRWVYQFDTGGKRTLAVMQKYTGQAWVDSTRLEYAYDEHRNLLQEEGKHPLNGLWTTYYRNTSTYDADGRILTYMYEGWWSDGRAVASRYIYTYDTNGSLLTRVYQGRSEGDTVWVNSTQEEYSYDSAGRWNSFRLQNWINGQWVKCGWSQYFYDEHGRDTFRLIEQWSGSEWVNFTRETRVYDDRGALTLSVQQQWLDGAWADYRRETDSYDESGNSLITLVEWGWRSRGWVPGTRRTWTYDVQQRRVGYLSEGWDVLGGLWWNEFRQGYAYDAEGRIAEVWDEEWADTVWSRHDGLARITVVDSAHNSYDFSGYNTVFFHYKTIQTDVASMRQQTTPASRLFPNYPNPFNPSTTIRYTLPRRAHVTLTIFNTLGERVAELVNGDIEPGMHEVRFDGSTLASGVYFYRLLAGTYVEVRKMTVTK